MITIAESETDNTNEMRDNNYANYRTYTYRYEMRQANSFSLENDRTSNCVAC